MNKLSIVFATVCASALLFPLPAPTAFAEEEAKDPLDAQIARLLAKDDSTAGQMQAYDKGIDLWDREMNRVYGELMKQLSPAGREALKVSQRAWLAWRDAQARLIQETYGRAAGTMYRPMATAHVMETVKARTLQLRRYLEIVEESR